MKLSTKLMAATALLAIGAVGGTQIEQLAKVIGIGELVRRFGPDINREVNKLTGHKDSNAATTKVVPILSVGVGRSSAIGAAQVTGSKAQVDKVQAVAQPQVDVFGNTIRIRALIPVSSTDVSRIRKVEGVGVSALVDVRL
ncbi:MAG: hypothetical protein ACK4XJ_03830 [Fimbriimonadaceae bacterium]